MRGDIRMYQWLIACMWLGRGSSLNRLYVRGWVFLAIFQRCQKIIDMFHPIQRMFNCFKGFDGKASHVWLVITPCSKFVHVLKENSVVNISPLNEQPVIIVFSPVSWWSCLLKGFTVYLRLPFPSSHRIVCRFAISTSMLVLGHHGQCCKPMSRTT